MIIGVVGKANTGKSTFFKAATLAEVEIAPYPFTTIEKNEGVAFVKLDCVDKELNTKCNPRFGYCLDGKRFSPIRLIDVAGLVPGAYEGKGLGSKFLNDLNEADALIHVIDVSGSTNENGVLVEPLSYYPGNDIRFLEKELDYWYLSIIKKVWEKDSKKMYQEKKKVSESLAKQLSGLKVTERMVEDAIKELPAKIIEWKEKDLLKLSTMLRKLSKPIIIAANKIDIPGSKDNLEKIKKEFPSYLIIPCSAESELALREAAKKSLIKYVPGENYFEVTSNDLNEKQKKALSFIKENVLDKLNSTGIQDCLDSAVFKILKYIAIFPGGVNKLQDSEGRILPDCFLLPPESTALDFAFKLHTDIGKNFVKAIDVKKRIPVGKDYKLKNRDVIEIKTS
ncbi:MAG TPA: redox-regulated ATPase YchF [Candidatus Nanoarchaeia archaeon]|nr:redox-regulated ATPase YchF [Candidatus Nanoarchaeia archaeon]